MTPGPRRAIVGFHQDDEGHGWAELRCGLAAYAPRSAMAESGVGALRRRPGPICRGLDRVPCMRRIVAIASGAGDDHRRRAALVASRAGWTASSWRSRDRDAPRQLAGRHSAKSNPDNVPPERQLDEKGRTTAAAMGDALRRLKIPIGEVLTSPAYRARETARLARLRIRGCSTSSARAREQRAPSSAHRRVAAEESERAAARREHAPPRTCGPATAAFLARFRPSSRAKRWSSEPTAGADPVSSAGSKSRMVRLLQAER